MNNITEIIPDDIPEWATKAIKEGNFFRQCIFKVKEANDLLDECEATIDQLLTVYVPYNDISQKGGKELITKIKNRNKP